MPFGYFLRQIIPHFVIRPVQAIDRPMVRSRGRVTVRCLTAGCATVETEFVLDLFEPPVHIKHLSACLEFDRVNPDQSFTRIAEALHLPHLTVKRVFAYARLMKERGVATPYVELRSPPAHASRWRRATHENPEVNRSCADGQTVQEIQLGE